MLEDPQFAAREAIVDGADHPVFGPVSMQNAFPKLSATPGRVRWPGPALGEHTDEVLAARAGCSPERLAELQAPGRDLTARSATNGPRPMPRTDRGGRVA